jgi:hypothetical protein
VKIFVKTKPQAKSVGVEKIDDTHFVISVKEPPEKGKANEGVRRALADHLKTPRSSVVILAGHTARNKIVEIV